MNRVWLIARRYEQFIKFSIVGGINTLISLIVYVILLHLGVWYLLSSVLGYLAGLLNSYLLNSKWVFNKKMEVQTGAKFIGVYLTALIFNIGLMYLLVDIGSIDRILSQVLVVGFNLIYNYLLNKLWTFRN